MSDEKTPSRIQPTREQLVTRIYNKASADQHFDRMMRGFSVSQVRMIVNIVLRCRREVAAEFKAPQGRGGE